jgi:hypothetical protein
MSSATTSFVLFSEESVKELTAKRDELIKKASSCTEEIDALRASLQLVLANRETCNRCIDRLNGVIFESLLPINIQSAAEVSVANSIGSSVVPSSTMPERKNSFTTVNSSDIMSPTAVIKEDSAKINKDVMTPSANLSLESSSFSSSATKEIQECKENHVTPKAAMCDIFDITTGTFKENPYQRYDFRWKEFEAKADLIHNAHKFNRALMTRENTPSSSSVTDVKKETVSSEVQEIKENPVTPKLTLHDVFDTKTCTIKLNPYTRTDPLWEAFEKDARFIWNALKFKGLPVQCMSSPSSATTSAPIDVEPKETISQQRERELQTKTPRIREEYNALICEHGSRSPQQVSIAKSLWKIPDGEFWNFVRMCTQMQQ